MNHPLTPIIFIFLLVLLTAGAVHAKTNPLSPGDVAIIGIHGDDLDGNTTNDNKDGFAWVNLVPLDSGTILYFTDDGWRSTNQFKKSEGALKYTAPSAIPVGTVFQIEFDDSPAGPFTTSDSGGIGGTYVDAADANVGGTVMEFVNFGDNLFIFDGTTASPNFLFAWKPNGPYQFDSTGNNTTALPSRLTDGETAISTVFTFFADDNSRYMGITTGNRSTLLAAITNKINWEGNRVGPVDFGGGDGDITNGTLGTGFSVTPPPTVNVTVGNASQPEGDSGSSSLTFTANRTGDMNSSVQFDYETMDGTAQAGVDYTSTSDSVVFPSLDSQETFNVPILGDRFFDSNRQFSVDFSNPVQRPTLGNGQLFQTATGDSFTTFVAIGDLNGDGLADLVTANNGTTNSSSPSLSVSRNITLLGGTSASFAGAQIRDNQDVDIILGLALSDINTDGRLDIVFTGLLNSFYVAFNETASGATSFSLTTEQTFFPSSAYLTDLAVDDINQDGKPDVVTRKDHEILVNLNTTTQFSTTGSFATEQNFTDGLADFFQVLTGDVNQDQKPDIIGRKDQSVHVFLNTTPPSDATVTLATPLSFTGFVELKSTALVDLNADGALDLLVVDDDINVNEIDDPIQISVYRNTTPPGGATASFAAPQVFSKDGGSRIFTGDLNGDGKKDFVVGNDLYLNETPALATTFTFTEGSISGLPSSPEIGDLNNNGIPDLAGPGGGTNTTVVMNNTVPVDLTIPSSSNGTIQEDDAPDSVTIAAGNNQSTLVNTAFATNLAVDVRNAAGSLVEEVEVTFEVPGSGPSGDFGGTDTVGTNASGRATAPQLTANAVAGSFQVTAQTFGGSNPSVSFDLTNTVHTPTPTSTFTPTNTPTSTDTPTNSPIPTIADTDTPTPTATPSDTPTDGPTATPTDTPTDGPSPTPTDTPTDGPTPTATDTPTDGPSPTPTDTPTDGPTPTPTDTPTDGPSPTPTETPTDGPSPTPTETITPGGPTLTPTETPTDTPTDGPSPTPTDTITPGGPTLTPTDTPTEGPSPTPTDTITPGGPTLTPTTTPGGPTLTPTNTPTDGPSPPPTETFTEGPSPTPTETPTPGGFADFDLFPPPSGDGKIDARDLMLWLQDVREESSTSDLLFDFLRFWENGNLKKE